LKAYFYLALPRWSPVTAGYGIVIEDELSQFHPRSVYVDV